METKKCSKCGEIKELNYFYFQKGGQYGVKAKCKECEKLYTNLKRIIKPKKIYPCIKCGKLISKENTFCTICKPFKKKFTDIKCDWCNELKNEKCFSNGSKTAYKNGKRKIYCIECKSKYQKEIDKKYSDEQLKKDFFDKHFNLKNGDIEKFKKYLIRSSYLQHKYMIEIDIDSYNLAVELKKEAKILKCKKQTQKRSIRRKLDPEFKNHLSKLSKERYLKNGESEKRKKQKLEWAKNNKEKSLKNNYKWKEKNRDHYNKKRRELFAKRKGFNTLKEYSDYLLQQKIIKQNKVEEQKILKEKQKEEKRKQREIEKQYKIEKSDQLKEIEKQKRAEYYLKNKERYIKNSKKNYKESRVKINGEFMFLSTAPEEIKPVLKKAIIVRNLKSDIKNKSIKIKQYKENQDG